jgi:PKD repeat protein
MVAALSGFAQVISTFDTDTDNWHSEGDGDYYWEAATGNPGGCFRVDDDATGDWNNGFAPVKFLGNWSSATTSDYISANVFIHQINGNYSVGTYVFKIKGPGGEATAFVDVQPPLDTWNTYTAYLDPANWTLISGTWSQILQQVNELVVRVEYINGDEYDRIDNVQLSFTPVVIPVVPVVCSDFEAGGFDGWSFGSTAGVSNQPTGGNPGHYIRITDGTGISTAYPPPKYLGDWNQLDNHNADVRVDLKVTDFTAVPLLSSYFLRLSGPGGVAQFPMDYSISLAFNQWKTFVFPVDQAYWTMVSGTWADLMDHVNNFEIIVEFINGTEVVWLDNFCISNLPPVADFSSNKQIEFAGNPVQFNDLSAGGPVGWNWDFGDSQSSADQYPVHTYLTDDLYDVSLTASNNFGSDIEVKTNYIEILPIDECLKYEDNFDDGIINPLMITKNGTWSEADGNIRQTSNYFVTGNLLGGCYAMTGSLLWDNYVISCDMMSTDNDHIGLVFNWQDDLNTYMFYWNAEGSYRRLSKWVNGSETILASEAVPYLINIWYNVEITSVPGIITISIDGSDLFNVNDNTFTSGKAALFCSGNQSGYWDNFRVSCLGMQVQLQTWLEGPFNGSGMNTDLTGLTDFPLLQPYNIAPWNYDGSESVIIIPANVTDWVLIELRDATSAATATAATQIARQAAFLMNDGSIRSLDGSSNQQFNNLTIQHLLFAVIWHRNHLAVMSANPLTESAGVYSYDFTIGAGQAYNNGQKEIAPGIWGMIAGDADASGIVDSGDKSILWVTQAGLNGYNSFDLNLDSETENPDKDDFWLPNIGEESQVPE